MICGATGESSVIPMTSINITKTIRLSEPFFRVGSNDDEAETVGSGVWCSKRKDPSATSTHSVESNT